MVLASWASDLSGLTILILGVLGFVLALVFRKELKVLLERLTGFEWRNARVSAAPRPESPGASLTPKPDSEAPTDDSNSSEPAGSASSSEDPESNDDNADAVRSKMFRAFFERKRNEGEQSFQRLKQLVDDPVEGKRDEIRRAGALFMGGLDNSALGVLDRWTEDEEVAWFALRMKGLCLSHAGKHQAAAEALRKAASNAEDPKDNAEVLALRSQSLTAMGELTTARHELEEALRSASDPAAQRELWEAVAKVYKKADEKVLAATALHKVAELWGNRSNSWFAAGYAYGSVDSEELAPMAIHCYQAALRFDPESHWAINNLGAELSGLQMQILAVDRYREAESLGNSLAMANMAEKYLFAGFAQDAQELIDKARESEKPDDKVATVGLMIRDNRAEMKKRLDELVESANQHASFFTGYAEAQLDPSPSEIAGQFKLTTGKMAIVTRDGDEIAVTWQEGGSRSHRRASGVLSGRTVIGPFQKQSTWPYSDDEVHWEADGKTYIVFDDQASKLTILRVKDDTTESFRGDRLPRTDS